MSPKKTHSIDPFDFDDLSDMPEELRAKMQTETSTHAQDYAKVVLKGAEAGHTELNINQIIVAATRMGMEVPTQQTVRGYLNKAEKMGWISKPTRQTYGPPEAVAPEPEAKDPLADI